MIAFPASKGRNGTGESKSSKPEVADIFRMHGNAYRKSHSLPKSHLKVIHDIGTCRTSELGGHLYKCNLCGYEHPAYNSCCNRHCPKCQSLSKARWLEARNAELLPVTYFHDVFTLPHELNPWIRYNKRVIYNILFQSVSQTLLEFGANPKNGIGGKLGFITVLHSWDQQLLEHHHLHCIIPGGALAFNEKSWMNGNSKYLFPVKALSIVFRGKFTDLLEKAFFEGKIVCPDGKDFKQLLVRLRKIKWVVYSKPAFGGPEKFLDYLGRYVHRVAISNDRIKKFKNGKVTFAYKDRKNGNRKKENTVPGEEFIRRFLLHVLPDGYMRIRYFGFLGNRHKKRKISLIRTFLGLPVNMAEAEKKNPAELILKLTGKDISKCPKCKTGTMKIQQTIPKLVTYIFQNIINPPQLIDSS